MATTGGEHAVVRSNEAFMHDGDAVRHLHTVALAFEGLGPRSTEDLVALLLEAADARMAAPDQDARRRAGVLLLRVVDELEARGVSPRHGAWRVAPPQG